MKRFTLLLILFLFTSLVCLETQAQVFKKLEKKVTRKVNEKIDKKVDQKIDESLNEMDGTGKKDREIKSTAPASGEANRSASAQTSPMAGGFSYSSKFDFVPGDKILLYEDFSGDAIGDLPAAWNTNGTAEVVKLNNQQGQWMKMKSGSLFIPDLDKTLPEDYTLEFDLCASGLDRNTSSNALVEVFLSESKALNVNDKNFAGFSIPFCQYIDVSMVARNNVSDDKDAILRSVIKTDLRKDALSKMHVAISANKKRLRVWISENKEIDIPRLMPNYNKIKYIKFFPKGFKDDKENIFITNVRLAEGGQDLRSQLETKGKYSTTGILFHTGSANILPESAGVIREIATVLKANSSMKVRITGHTDSDGEANNNLKLSQQRAASVKDLLVKDFGINGARIITEGKGESAPVADNANALGKAQNRRVDFEKL